MNPPFDPFDIPRQEKAPPWQVPEGNLKDLDLDRELYSQYHKAKNLLESNEYDTETNLSAKVSAMNSIVNILTQITKLQADLYNAQTIAKIETTLIATLKKFPELSDEFLEAYEKASNA